jgi:hypothetical protein
MNPKENKLFLMERQFIFNYAPILSEEDELWDIDGGYTVIYNEDFSGSGQSPTIDITDNQGEDVNNPILVLEIQNVVNEYIYKPKNLN